MTSYHSRLGSGVLQRVWLRLGGSMSCKAFRMLMERNRPMAFNVEYKFRDHAVDCPECRDLYEAELLKLYASPRLRPWYMYIVEDCPLHMIYQAARVAEIILCRAIEMRASGVEIEPAGRRVRVRFMSDGKEKIALIPGKVAHNYPRERLKAMAGLDYLREDIPQKGEFSIKYDICYHVDVSTQPRQDGEIVHLQITKEEPTPEPTGNE